MEKYEKFETSEIDTNLNAGFIQIEQYDQKVKPEKNLMISDKVMSS